MVVTKRKNKKKIRFGFERKSLRLNKIRIKREVLGPKNNGAREKVKKQFGKT